MVRCLTPASQEETPHARLFGSLAPERGEGGGEGSASAFARRLAIVCILLGTVAFPPGASAQTLDSTESRFLAGLRERQLFELAETYCRRQLAESYVDKRRRAETTIELARTLLESALYAKSPERETRFSQASALLDEAIRTGRDDPWAVPLAVQRGLIDLVWGELLREEAQALNSPEAAMTPVRDRLRIAITQLRVSQTAVDERLRKVNFLRPGDTPKPDEPSAAEWSSLKRNVDFQLARALRNQGESYAAGTPDRTDAFDQALEVLAGLSRSDAADAIAWQARLDEALCRRKLGDLDAAERVLTIIDSQSPPSDVAARARAERIRVQLDAGALDAARKLVTDADADPASNSPAETRLAALEWLLASSRAAAKAGKTAEAADAQARAAALARIIAERHAPYWARQAETLTASAVVASPATGDAAQLLKAAESFYRQGNVDRALEIYDQTFAKALEAKRADVAFDAGFTAAAIEQQRSRYALAAERFLRLATTLADHPRAAEAHLAGIFNTAQTLAAAKPEDAAKQLTRYGELLAEQIARWPTNAATNRARVWLGRLQNQRRDWTTAIAAFSGVPPDDPAAPEAVAGLAEAYASQFAELRDAGQGAPLAAAERTLAIYAPGLPDRLPVPLSPVARSAALAAVRLGLEFADDRFATSSVMLSQLSATPDLPADQKAAVETLLVPAEVGAGRIDSAVTRAEQLTSVAPSEAALAVALMEPLAARQPPNVRTKCAAIVLRLVELLQPVRERIAAKDLNRIEIAEARALSTLGRTVDARQAWERLAKEHPHDGDLQEAFAEFLASQSDRGATEAAVAKWREIERASPESTPRWYRARLALALAYEKLDEKPRAAQLIELTAALHPDLGGDALKPRFEEVLKRCR